MLSWEHLFTWLSDVNLDPLSESLLVKMYLFAGEVHTFPRFVLSFAILSTWCSGELYLNHPGRLTYLNVYRMFPDSELPSVFCVIFKLLLYCFVWFSRPLRRVLTSTKIGATCWKRSSLLAYLQAYPSACSFSLQCDSFWNGRYAIYITLLSPLDFLSLKKSLKVFLSFFSLSLWKFTHLSVYLCWYLNKELKQN